MPDIPPVILPTIPSPETISQYEVVPTKTLSAIGGGPLTDFLISDVCVDANDKSIKGDPATCTRHRDLKFGESVPYFRTDRSWGFFYQASMSYPVQAPDGSLLAMKLMEFGGTTPDSAFRDFDRTSPAIDGYDLHEANGKYVSIISSQDPAAYKPIWAPGCRHDDGWVLWPSALATGTEGHETFQLNYGPQCPSWFGGSFTNWHYYSVPLTYTSGKTLSSIVSWHYNQSESDLAKISAIEVFYNTREYGATRWEAWNSAGPAEDQSGACNGATEANYFGVKMYRVACRDWTFTKDIDVPVNPMAMTAGADLVFSKNSLASPDFAQGQLASWKTAGAGASWRILADSEKNNHLNAACAGECSGASAYQDVDVSQWTGNLTVRYGAIVKAARTARAILQISMLDANGTTVAQAQRAATFASNWQNVDAAFAWNFSARPIRTIRYEILFTSPSEQYSLDEAYLTPSL